MTVDAKTRPAVLARFRKAVEDCGLSGTLLSEQQSADRIKDTFHHEAASAASAVLLLSTEEEIRRALSHARLFGLSVHPISSGHNWGYGTARPADPRTSIIFDLSAMNRILEFDRSLGVVVVEPGVTQDQLETFLAHNDLDFMVPTTGAGPSCSLVGNVLERGYGMTPIADHFQAVLGVHALFVDGTIYRSPLWHEDGGTTAKAPIYRWGVGPYLDGLFAQNGGAIVTRLALQLIPRPAHVEMFVFWIGDDSNLEDVVETIRRLLTSSGLVIGGINLMNAARVSAMAGATATKGAVWIGTGIVYGEPSVVRAGRKVIRCALSGLVRRIAFVNEERLQLLERLARTPILGNRLAPLVSTVRSAYQMLSGHPGEFALALAYGGDPDVMPAHGRDPARDRCGLLWYAPLVPMSGECARQYVRMVERVCHSYGFAAPITFSTLSIAGFDSTVPLIFPCDEENSARAFACLKTLIGEGRTLGFHPYRFHSALMDEATSGALDHWHLVEKIRTVIDPENLIAPGRYQRRASPSTPTHSVQEIDT